MCAVQVSTCFVAVHMPITCRGLAFVTRVNNYFSPRYVLVPLTDFVFGALLLRGIVSISGSSLLGVQVPNAAHQHGVMIEAVENHMPEVVVIDEIGTEAEALAARTIAQRGVQLVATAHGGQLANVLQNPALQDLLGGVQRHVFCVFV